MRRSFAVHVLLNVFVLVSFSPCGLYLYSIQSPRRGGTHLIKWVITRNVTTDAASALSAYPLEVVPASKVPSTRLAINESGSLLAVGTSDGNVHVFNSATMKKVRWMYVYLLSRLHSFSMVGAILCSA